jgi:23S rRNA (pseudouridine1915-N3)-methyltransferase
MNLKIIAVGKTKEPYLQDGEAGFLKRIQRYTSIESVVVKEERILQRKSPEAIRQAEATRIQARIQSDEWVVALDIKGKPLDSEQFAQLIEAHMARGMRTMTFVIGGTLGLSQGFLRTCNQRLSLSKMTFPHQLVRLVLLEQIYRAFTIIRGEKYHK